MKGSPKSGRRAAPTVEPHEPREPEVTPRDDQGRQFIPLTRGDDGKYVIPNPPGGGSWQQIGDRLVQVEAPTVTLPKRAAVPAVTEE